MADSTLFVGAGAVGGYFGGRLAAAGKDVTFLVRPSRAASLAENGLRIRTVDQSVEVVHPHLVTAAELVRPYDLVVLAVKAYALESAIADLAPAVGPDTIVVPLLNGLKHVARLSEVFGPERVFGGVCVVSTTMNDDGEIVQLNTMQRLSFGPLSGGADPRTDTVVDALSGGGFRAFASETILQDMWDKWILLAGLGVLTCLMRGTVGQVNSAPGGTLFAERLADELDAVAAASGYEPSARYRDYVRTALTDPTSQLTSSMYRDLVGGRPTEADQIVGDLAARATALGVETPLIALANTHLAVYESSRLSAATA